MRTRSSSSGLFLIVAAAVLGYAAITLPPAILKSYEKIHRVNRENLHELSRSQPSDRCSYLTEVDEEQDGDGNDLHFGRRRGGDNRER